MGNIGSQLIILASFFASMFISIRTIRKLQLDAAKIKNTQH